MSDEPTPPTDLAPPPVMPPPVVTPPPLPPPKPVTPSWVFTLLKTVLAVLVVALVTAGMIFLYITTGWEGIWKVTLIGTCGLFAILSVLVTVGGALDVRKLLRRLREREASGDPDSGD
jgi:hypothetical protein